MCITPSIWPHSGGLKKNCENVLELYIYIAFLPRKNETLLVKNYPLWIYFRNIFHRGEQAVMEFCWFETRKKESTKSVTRSGTQVRNRNLAEVAEEISWRPLWDWKSIPRKELKITNKKLDLLWTFFVHFSVAKKEKLLTKQFHISSNWEEERRLCYLMYRLYVQ